jgi:hypothetical protein
MHTHWARVPRGLIVAIVALGALPGCASSSSTQTGAEGPANAAPPVAPEIADAQWRTVTLQGLGLHLKLPDATGWHATTQPGAWRATHTATNTELTVRTWPGTRGTAEEGCWRELEQRTPDPMSRSAVLTLDEPRRQGELAGRVRLRTDADGSRVTGRVEVVLSGAGRCIALVGSTYAEGTGAAEVVGSRLAVVSEGIAGSLGWAAPEERVGEPPPLTP